MNRTQISGEYRALRYDLARTQRKFQNRRAVCKWTLVLLVAVMFMAVVISICSANTFGSAQPMQVETVVVEQGDSLWGIASRYADGRDVREVICEIKTFNSMEQADLYPGMVLEIPISA